MHSDPLSEFFTADISVTTAPIFMIFLANRNYDKTPDLFYFRNLEFSLLRYEILKTKL
jgi:hypothetical protein